MRIDDDCSPREELNCDLPFLGINISHPNLATLYTYNTPSEASRTFDNECSVERFLAVAASRDGGDGQLGYPFVFTFAIFLFLYRTLYNHYDGFYILCHDK